MAGWAVGSGTQGALGTVDPPVTPEGTRLRVGVHANGGSSSLTGGSEPTFASATATLGVTPYCERLYCTGSDRITVHRTRIEDSLASGILPIVSVKGTDAAYFTQLAADLATIDTGGLRFPLAAWHEPAGDLSFAAYSALQNRLYGAIETGTNNDRVVPMSLLNGFNFWSSGNQRRNRADTAPGNGAINWRPHADVLRSNNLDGIEGIDAYSAGSWAAGDPVTQPFGQHIRNFAKWASGVGYTDTSGVFVIPTNYPTTRLILGELGSPFASEIPDAIAALEECRYLAFPWWDKYDQHMVLDTVNYPSHNPDAVQKRAAWLAAYSHAIPANFDAI